MSSKLLASMLPARDWIRISWEAWMVSDLVGDSNLLWSKKCWSSKDKISSKNKNYLKSFPGSAFKRFVWTESLKVTPPSPSSLREPEANSTESRSTENSEFPCGSFTWNFLVRTSNLSWPRNIWFSIIPSASLALNVMFLEDSVERSELGPVTNIIFESFYQKLSEGHVSIEYVRFLIHRESLLVLPVEPHLQ